MTSLASLGRVNDVLRLDDLLPGPPPDDARPLLEKDVLREGGPDSPSVAPALLGENDLEGPSPTMVPSKFNCGISTEMESSSET